MEGVRLEEVAEELCRGVRGFAGKARGTVHLLAFLFPTDGHVRPTSHPKTSVAAQARH